MRPLLTFKEYFWLGFLSFCISIVTFGQVAASPGDTRYQKAPAEADLGYDCRAGYVFACVDLGVHYQVSGNPSKISWARSLYHQACVQGDARGCEYERNLRLSAPKLPKRTASQASASVTNARFGPVRLKARANGRDPSQTPKASVAGAKSVIAARLKNAPAPLDSRGADKSKTKANEPAIQAESQASRSPVVSTLRDQRPQPLKISDRVSSPVIALQTQDRSAAPIQAAAQATASSSGAGKEGGGLELGCARGDSAFCIAAGQVYAKSKVQADLPKAITSFQKACNLQNSSGCFALGAIYEIGKGVPSNLSQAAHYYDLSCREGNDLGCRMLRIMPPAYLASKTIAQIKK